MSKIDMNTPEFVDKFQKAFALIASTDDYHAIQSETIFDDNDNEVEREYVISFDDMMYWSEEGIMTPEGEYSISWMNIFPTKESAEAELARRK
jgi:hypothetical protein